MEHQTISKLLNDSTLSIFVTRKWIEGNNLSTGQYSVIKKIRFKTEMLRSDLCDYGDAYIVVEGERDLLAAAANENHKPHKGNAFKINVPFTSFKAPCT